LAQVWLKAAPLALSIPTKDCHRSQSVSRALLESTARKALLLRPTIAMLVTTVRLDLRMQHLTSEPLSKSELASAVPALQATIVRLVLSLLFLVLKENINPSRDRHLATTCPAGYYCDKLGMS